MSGQSDVPYRASHRGGVASPTVIYEHAPCVKCGGCMEFYSDRIIGYSMERCRTCRYAQPMSTQVVKPVEIPEWMVGSQDSPKQRARSAGGDGTCACCGQIVMAKGAVPAKYCGKPCRNKAWRQTNAEFLARGAERARVKRHARIAAGLTSRGTPRKRNYTSPKRRAA